MSLTHKQHECLAFIQKYIAINDGLSPSYEEIMKAMGLRSKSGVHRMVEGLIERGKLRKISGSRRIARCLELVVNDDDWSRGFAAGALWGYKRAKSGLPMGSRDGQ